MERTGCPTLSKPHSGRGPVSGRNSRLIRFIAGLFSCVFAAAAIAASTNSDAVDPVFGLVYRPDKIKFDPAPPNLLVTCPALTNQRWTRKLWIYGQAVDTDKTYLIVGGFYASRPPAPPELETDPQGAIIETRAAGCTLLGPAREVLRYPEGLLIRPVLHALDADLVRRYRAAFGGAAALDATLNAQHAMLRGPRDAALREALASKGN